MKVYWKTRLRCLIPVLALLAAGCGSKETIATGDVEGTVTLAKKPLNGGMVSFYDPSSGRTAGATIQNGKFKFDKPIAAGTYEVSFLPSQTSEAPGSAADIKKERSARKVIPFGYQTGNTSGIKAEVKASQTNSFNWDLKKGGPPRPSAGNRAP